MATVLCLLYADPVDGHPTSYPRDDLPALDCYPGGTSLPTPQAIDFTPGELLGCVSGELGLRDRISSVEVWVTIELATLTRPVVTDPPSSSKVLTGACG